MVSKDYTPFSPGSPIHPEFFVGRIEQIEQVMQFIKEANSGKQANVFLTGDRGIGKSSFASLLHHLALSKENMLGIHAFLGSVTSLEEMIRHIFDQILKETKDLSWFKNISSFFGKYIEEIGLFGVSVSFAPPKKELEGLVRNFPEALKNFIDKIKLDKKGLFLALDDINGLADKEDFANWYKSFVDETATRYKDFPVFIMLIGLPEKRKILSTLQPSLMRIFRPIEIEKLKDEEVEQFLLNAFKEVDVKVEKEALEIMVRFSGGLPILMHEIGDAAFRYDSNGIIDKNDAYAGIYRAAKIIGAKYLNPKVYYAIQSKRYRTILRVMGQSSISRYFNKAEFEKKLSDKEKKVFPYFLKKLRDLDIIEQDLERGRGAYRFVNEIYPIYIWIESERFKDKLANKHII
ncbi:hypothetical protein AMJ80_01200 [bacterium SM23_31]|nr:MAG: hypothetical protein AMJ80_01200 [bacterium SM23_31]